MLLLFADYVEIFLDKDNAIYLVLSPHHKFIVTVSNIDFPQNLIFHCQILNSEVLQNKQSPLPRVTIFRKSKRTLGKGGSLRNLKSPELQ